MNLYESVTTNLKESEETVEQLKAQLVDYLNNNYGSNWTLVDGVNDLEGDELLTKLAEEYIDCDYEHTYYSDGSTCSFLDFIESTLDDPHGLLTVEVNNEINEAEETSTLKVETFDTEDTGGHVIVGFGKLSDGTYYSISTDVVCIWDTDWYKLHFEEPEEASDDLPIEDESDHIIAYYDYDTPEYENIAKQCLAIDKNKASYCVYMED